MIEWEQLFSNGDTSTNISLLNTQVEEICCELIPKKSTRKRKHFIPRDRRIMMRKRSKYMKRLTSSTQTEQCARLLQNVYGVEDKLKKSYEEERHQQERQAVDKIRTNPKFFYRYVKRFSRTKSTIGPLLSDDGKCITDSKQMAEILNKQYNSAFSTPRADKKIDNPISFFNEVVTEQYMTDIRFNNDDIKAAINKLSPHSSAGPDGFPAILLKKCRDSLTPALSLLLRQTIDSGNIPQKLKEATIIPLHKGDSKGIAKNYRPVSLTSHIMKTFERVIRNQLVHYLETNNLLRNTQHGFRSGRSCLSQLLNHYDNIIHELEKGNNVDVIYLDFAKAFDKVDHGILCHKLKQLGITGKIGAWIHNFLNERQQAVIVDGQLSTLSDVLSSVPQGTVLGPILFLILINDIGDNIASTISSFADDTRVLRGIQDTNDILALQEDLRRVYEWQNDNNMQFNDKKFEVLRYGPNQDFKENYHYTGPNDQPITEKQQVRDLGVLMSNNNKFAEHINKVINTAKQKCGWIYRTFKSRDALLMKTLWTSLVQPHLDYCSQLWSPSKIGEIQRLEQVQRNYTSGINGLRELNYWERIHHLKMFSQQRRRERYRILYIWKMTQELVPNPGITTKISDRRGRNCTIPPLNNRAPNAITTMKENGFMVNGAKLFNILPRRIRDLDNCTLKHFKDELDRTLKTIPDNPPVTGYPSRNNSLLLCNML